MVYQGNKPPPSLEGWFAAVIYLALKNKRLTNDRRRVMIDAET
jgi:hypothetical protein